MTLRQLFKKVLIPCAAGVNAMNDGNAGKNGNKYGVKCIKRNEEGEEQGTKPSDLPLYSKTPPQAMEEAKEPDPPNSMEQAVGNIRRELWVWQDSLKGYRHKIVDVYRKTLSKADGPDGIPESCWSRNHLENVFNEKCYLPSPYEAQKTSAKEAEEHREHEDVQDLRSPWGGASTGPMPQFDRCGQPCSGDHRANIDPPSVCPPGYRPQIPAGFPGHRPQAPAGKPEHRPHAHACQPEHRQQAHAGQPEHRPQPKQTHLSEPISPPSEGSHHQESCRCCCSPEN